MVHRVADVEVAVVDREETGAAETGRRPRAIEESVRTDPACKAGGGVGEVAGRVAAVAVGDVAVVADLSGIDHAVATRLADQLELAVVRAAVAIGVVAVVALFAIAALQRSITARHSNLDRAVGRAAVVVDHVPVITLLAVE